MAHIFKRLSILTSRTYLGKLLLAMENKNAPTTANHTPSIGSKNTARATPPRSIDPPTASPMAEAILVAVR